MPILEDGYPIRPDDEKVTAEWKDILGIKDGNWLLNGNRRSYGLNNRLLSIVLDEVNPQGREEARYFIDIGEISDKRFMRYIKSAPNGQLVCMSPEGIEVDDSLGK